jgi:transcriptional regulator with XRE-family HTH domain
MVVRIGQRNARPRKTFFREWREHRGLTQEQLAARLDTNKSAISKIENGQSAYNQSSLEAIAAALMCEPADLISRPPNVPGRGDSVDELLSSADSDTRKRVVEVVKTLLKTG